MSLAFQKRYTHEQIVTYENGETVFREGESSRELYVVKSGSVMIKKSVNEDEDEVELAILTKGAFFGEMALLCNRPRDATVYANGLTELLRISPGGLLLKIRRDPSFAFEMLQQMSDRLRDANEIMLTQHQKEKISAKEHWGIFKKINFLNKNY